MSNYPPNVFKVSLEEVDMLKTEQQDRKEPWQWK